MNDLSIEQKIELFHKTNIFSMLKEEELQIIVKYSEVINFKENEIIYEAGSNATELYIIIDGEILITKNTEDGQKIDLARFMPSECFGELDLFNEIVHNTASIALKDTSLLIFPKKGTTLNDVLITQPQISAQILYKLLIIIAGRIRKTNKLISEKTPWIEDLKKQLHKDKLTGLYNKTYIDEELSQIIQKIKSDLSTLVIKPDNFKEINDNFGHETGDNALKFLGEIITSLLKESVFVSRYKGDEFVIVLPEECLDSTKQIADKIRITISKSNIKNLTNNNDFFIKLSIGISNTKIHSTNSKELLDIAYKNMFEARNSGGDRII